MLIPNWVDRCNCEQRIVFMVVELIYSYYNYTEKRICAQNLFVFPYDVKTLKLKYLLFLLRQQRY
jgi:hypothetical protein